MAAQALEPTWTSRPRPSPPLGPLKPRCPYVRDAPHAASRPRTSPSAAAGCSCHPGSRSPASHNCHPPFHAFTSRWWKPRPTVRLSKCAKRTAAAFERRRWLPAPAVGSDPQDLSVPWSASLLRPVAAPSRSRSAFSRSGCEFSTACAFVANSSRFIPRIISCA